MSENTLLLICALAIVAWCLGMAIAAGVVLSIHSRRKWPEFLGEQFPDGDDPWTPRS